MGKLYSLFWKLASLHEQANIQTGCLEGIDDDPIARFMHGLRDSELLSVDCSKHSLYCGDQPRFGTEHRSRCLKNGELGPRCSGPGC
jgi:hypothetical protein